VEPHTPVGRNLPSLASLFATAVRNYPTRVFIESADGRQMTFEEAGVRVVSIAERLRDESRLAPGDAFVAYTEETVPLILLLLAAAVGGYVLVPVSKLFSTAQLRDISARANAREVVVGAVVPSALDGDANVSRERVLAALGAAAERVSGTEPVVVLPTSGSTGTPKLVVRSHHAYVRLAHHTAEELAPAWRTVPPRILLGLTLNHGLAGLWLAVALRTAGTLFVPSRTDVATPLAEVRRFGPELLPMVPRMLRAFCQQRAALDPTASLFGPRARVVWLAGAPADQAVLRELVACGVAVGEGYGTTESSPISSAFGEGWRSGYQGRLYPDVEVRIADDGELRVRCPGMMTAYLGDEEATRAVLDEDGFYCTGDLVEITPDRYVRVYGRKRDVFNTSDGSNVYPARIETLLEERVDGVLQSFLVGDRRDFLTAFLVVGGATSAEPDGFLAPELEGARYTDFGRRLAELNATLEGMERVRAFALFGRPFVDAVYAQVSQGKVRRDRAAFEKGYVRRIDDLYASSERDGPAFVPSSG
jgi:long-subunit acyl-CoA synthetase (AMP-forming)